MEPIIGSPKTGENDKFFSVQLLVINLVIADKSDHFLVSLDLRPS